MINVWDTLFTHPPPCDGFVHGISFEQRIGQFTMGLLYLPFYIHAELRIISWRFSGLATDSPCGVWGRGWSTSLLYVGLRWGFMYLKWQLLFTFGIMEWNFLLISCVYSCFAHNCLWFSSQMFFHSEIFFSYVFCIVLFHRRSLESF